MYVAAQCFSDVYMTFSQQGCMPCQVLYRTENVVFACWILQDSNSAVDLLCAQSYMKPGLERIRWTGCCCRATAGNAAACRPPETLDEDAALTPF